MIKEHIVACLSSQSASQRLKVNGSAKFHWTHSTALSCDFFSVSDFNNIHSECSPEQFRHVSGR